MLKTQLIVNFAINTKKNEICSRGVALPLFVNIDAFSVILVYFSIEKIPAVRTAVSLIFILTNRSLH